MTDRGIVVLAATLTGVALCLGACSTDVAPPSDPTAHPIWRPKVKTAEDMEMAQ